MIETRLSLAEALWALQALGLEPVPDSPLREPLEAQPAAPTGSPAEASLLQALAQRGLLDAAGRPGPFLATALRWLAEPSKVISLARFGPGGADLIHLALREGAAVECQREATGFLLRYPFTEAELPAWLAQKGGLRGR